MKVPGDGPGTEVEAAIKSAKLVWAKGSEEDEEEETPAPSGGDTPGGDTPGGDTPGGGGTTPGGGGGDYEEDGDVI